MYKTIAMSIPDGRIVFTKFANRFDLAYAWPPSTPQNLGLSDLVAFHQAWPNGQQPPEAIELSDGRVLEIVTEDSMEWRRRQEHALTDIAEMDTAIRILYESMDESTMEYFGIPTRSPPEH